MIEKEEAKIPIYPHITGTKGHAMSLREHKFKKEFQSC